MHTTPISSDLEDVPRLHGDALYRCAMQLTGDRSSALDLVQDTYVRALRHGLAQIPAEKIRGWLMVIAKHQFVDNYRAAKRIVLDERVVYEAVAPDPENDDSPPWSNLGLEDMNRVLGRLNPLLARVFRMHAFEALDYATIAQRLNIPVSTVGTRLLRARLHLRQALLDESATCLPLTPRAGGRRSQPHPASQVAPRRALRTANG